MRSARRLPFDDASFDVVTGFNSFQYAADRGAALREARRVLRDDGRVLMAVWGRPDQCDGEIVLDAVRALLPPPPGVLDKAILDAGLPFRRDDGSYRFDNIFRFAVARVR